VIHRKIRLKIAAPIQEFKTITVDQGESNPKAESLADELKAAKAIKGQLR
jgi:hypothetical protein